MATASFSTLSPNKSVYRSRSTCSSWKMASTVTRKKHTQICRVSWDTDMDLSKKHSLNAHLHNSSFIPTSDLHWENNLISHSAVQRFLWAPHCLQRKFEVLGTSLLQSALFTFNHLLLYPLPTLCCLLKPHWTCHSFPNNDHYVVFKKKYLCILVHFTKPAIFFPCTCYHSPYSLNT